MDITDKLGSMLMKFDPKVGLRILEGRIAYHSGESRDDRLSTPMGIKKIYFRAVVWLSWQSHNHFQYQRSAVGIQSSTKYYIKHWPIF